MIWGRATEDWKEENAPWKSKFAWLPTFLDDGRTVWFERYEEKKFYYYSRNLGYGGWLRDRRLP